ncbi:MAG: hypothetical protein ACE5G2_01080 [Candidatus Krumholzibacteriia bacterium]
MDLPIEYAPGLVEDVVLRALDGHRLEGEFRGGRDRIYDEQNAELRERAFGQLHATWFRRLRLDAPLVRALGEQPSIARFTRVCRVVAARTRRQEGAELFVNPPPSAPDARSSRAVLIRLRPTTFLDEQGMLFLLRHEFMHISDMLDPVFGYRPSLSRSDAGAVSDALVCERYRVLWDTTIEGRLQRRGWADAEVRQRSMDDFRAAFPMRREDAERAFATWFDTPDHTHADLVAFAENPGLGCVRCSLCGAPTRDPVQASGLAQQVVEQIQEDCAGWRPQAGVCRQCADLYSSRCLEPERPPTAHPSH